MGAPLFKNALDCGSRREGLPYRMLLSYEVVQIIKFSSR